MTAIEGGEAAMTAVDRVAELHSYLKALAERDLSRCVDFYTDDAVILFVTGLFQKRQAIQEWHEARFAANIQISRVEGTSVQGEAVVTEFVFSSNRLKAWRISSMRARGTFLFEGSKFKDVRFALVGGNPFENWQ